MPAFIQQLRLVGGSVQQQLQQSGGRLGMSAEDQNHGCKCPIRSSILTAPKILIGGYLPDAKG